MPEETPKKSRIKRATKKIQRKCQEYQNITLK